ncbi:MAG TPA: hypothetical protein DEQ87_18750 [Algoriphagus sp.]|nr:hypothetical protein [Algoriphagus sp.]MAN87148.1 hypothetical protein [Algoriphagus sp.]HAD50340.1 hypothetical protein [Algoriphagus sp.]HAH36974.1 hypothetical protein [Algoriphagus sp.]HAS60496.1 hypothetical protein [Algoriphagus sp.]
MFQRKPKNRGTEGNKKPKLICLSGFNALVFQKKCGLEELVKFSKNLTALGITFEIGVNDISWLRIKKEVHCWTSHFLLSIMKY